MLRQVVRAVSRIAFRFSTEAKTARPRGRPTTQKQRPVQETQDSAENSSLNVINTENFLNTMNDLMLEPQIERFRQILISFRSKLRFSNYQSTDNKSREQFITTCRLHFERCNVPELSALLEKVDLASLSPDRLKRTSMLDLQEELDKQHDFKRFYNYVDRIIPKAKYLVNNYDSEQAGSQVDEMEAKLFNRVTSINFNLQRAEESNASASSLSAEDLPKLDLLGEEEIDFIQTNTVEWDQDNSHLGQDLEGAQATKTPEEIDNIVKGYFASELDDFRYYPFGTVRAVVNQKSEVQHTRSAAQAEKLKLVMLTQEGHDKLEVPTVKSDWVYVFGLPYNLHELGLDRIKEEINTAVTNFGMMKRAHLYSYSDVLQTNNVNQTLLIPKDLETYFEPGRTQGRAIGYKDRGQTFLGGMPGIFQQDHLEVEGSLLESDDPEEFDVGGDELTRLLGANPDPQTPQAQDLQK